MASTRRLRHAQQVLIAHNAHTRWRARHRLRRSIGCSGPLSSPSRRPTLTGSSVEGRATMDAADELHELLTALYRDESRRVLATLIRLLGDFDLAEEALHEAFRAAMEQWPQSGVPANPRAWLVSAGRFKAIDNLRRQRRFQPLGEHVEPGDDAPLGGGEVVG